MNPDPALHQTLDMLVDERIEHRKVVEERDALRREVGFKIQNLDMLQRALEKEQALNVKLSTDLAQAGKEFERLLAGRANDSARLTTEKFDALAVARGLRMEASNHTRGLLARLLEAGKVTGKKRKHHIEHALIDAQELHRILVAP